MTFILIKFFPVALFETTFLDFSSRLASLLTLLITEISSLSKVSFLYLDLSGSSSRVAFFCILAFKAISFTDYLLSFGSIYDRFLVALEMAAISILGAWSLFTAYIRDFYPSSTISLSISEKPRFSVFSFWATGSGLDDLLVKLPLLVKPLSSSSSSS